MYMESVYINDMFSKWMSIEMGGEFRVHTITASTDRGNGLLGIYTGQIGWKAGDCACSPPP